MQVRQALRRFVVVLALAGSLVLGSALGSSAAAGYLASSSALGAAQRPAIAGIYMNYDSISVEGTSGGFDWISSIWS